MLFGTKKLIGIDIGTANIKMAELDVSRKSASLSAFSIMPTPPRAITGGEVTDPAAISDTLNAMLAARKSKRKHAAVGLWGTSVITKRISIPQMDEKLVAGQIKWEAEQYIPFDINEVNVDFKTLKQFQASPDTMEVLLVAARQDQAFLYQDIVQSSGLTCSLIDVSGFALANCFLGNWPAAKGQTVAVMNIGAGVTNFIVIESGEVIFCRDIPAGGLTYTTEISKNMGMSIEEAEALKISACNGGAAPDEVSKIIQASHDLITEEIQSSLDFFINTTPGLPVQQCFVTGGASRTTGLVAALNSQTKLNLEMFDPFRMISINPKTLDPGFVGDVRDFAAVAVGLGLRQVGDS